MSRLFYHTMQDNVGNLLFDVSGTMRLAGTGTLATIYGDEALTVILPNPMTNHPSYGSFKCFLGAGDYDFYMAKSGYTFETLTGVQGHGTMAQQDAANVAITGGTIAALTSLGVAGASQLAGLVGIGGAQEAGWALRVFGRLYLPLVMGSGGVPHVLLEYDKVAGNAITFRQQNGDVGGGAHCGFQNNAGALVGEIISTATATAYNTASDARLKHAIAPLTGELALLQALRPVAFRWNADDSPGVGFLAHEVAAVVAGVITGEENAVDAEGQIVRQMIDYSKLVPFLVGACQTLAAQVESVTARLVVLEDALGI